MSDSKKQLMVSIRNRAIVKNPVLFEAAGIAPVVAMVVSLKSAIMLAVVASIELVLIEMIACLLLKKIKASIRVAVYAVLGVFINVPLFMLFNRLAPNETASVGIFLPLIAVNSLVALHCERVAVRTKFKETVIDAFSSVIGYALIIFIVGIVREILGSGTIYSVDLKLPVQLKGMLMPFGGFLILGFIAAIFKMLIARKYPEERPEAAFNLSEISESHVDNFKNLMAEDFDPFEEIWSRDTEKDDGIKSYRPKINLHSEKVHEEQPVNKAEKPEKAEKIREKKPKEVKEKKIKQKKNKKEKTSVAKRASVTRDVEVKKKDTSRREYVSEFEDLLSELDNKKNDNTDEQKGGDDE